MQGPPRTPLSLPRSGQEWRRASTWVRSGKFQPWVCPGRRPCSVSPRTQRLGGKRRTGGSPPPSTHDALSQRHQLLFLFLPLLKVDVDERLQLQQVLFHALPVDVLGDEGWEPGHPQVIPREGASPAAPLRSVRRGTPGPQELAGLTGAGGGGRRQAAAVRSMSSRWQRTPCSDPRGP